MALKGLKPQMMVGYLGVGKESFRYWRESLDPNPHRSIFSSSDLFTYQLIKLLIREQGITLKLLKNCRIKPLFKYFLNHPLNSLVDHLLQIDTDSGSVEIFEAHSKNVKYGFSIHIVPLSHVINEHRNALERFGNSL